MRRRGNGSDGNSGEGKGVLREGRKEIKRGGTRKDGEGRKGKELTG